MAGFELSTYGRFSDVHRGLIGQLVGKRKKWAPHVLRPLREEKLLYIS